MKVTKDRINSILDEFGNKKILVLGDVMLDRYIWGKVSRISPEAPVPIVHVQRESSNLGGAANVAHNLAAMGSQAYIVGLIGNDQFGKDFTFLAKENRIKTSGLIYDGSRETTVKTRVIAHNHHVVRVDRESTEPVAKEHEYKILDVLSELIPECDAMIIEDYNKGLLTKAVISGAINIAQKHDKIVTVDPKFEHFWDYTGVTLFKPNRREVAAALGAKLDSEAKFREAGRELCEKLDAEVVLITRGEEGMTLFHKNGKMDHLETVAQEVYDVSGAGDTVISAVTLALASGANFWEAAYIANHAAAVAIREVGAFPVSLDELREAF